MNNILTFEDYKKMNIRHVESVIYRQFIEEDIKDDVNEGFIRKAINKAAGNFVQTALADEIEKGKELEKSIKDALDGLDKGFEEIKKRIDVQNSTSKTKLDAIEKVKDAIKAVQSQAFDTLTMIGSEGEIDFAGFMGSATISAAVNFGILFSPIRSLFITRKAYKYFLGIIKQTIRRNLLIIQLNFDQFENLILQKSFESEEDTEKITISNTIHDIITKQQEMLCKDSNAIFKRKNQRKEMRAWLDDFKKAQDMYLKQNKADSKSNPLRSLWEDQHNNTYTRTLEQIKQYINDDTQKELDALKNSITKLSGDDVDLNPYGELLIAAAEEYAIHTNHGINNNFIKMSSVFNLDNQKKLIELIVSTQEENEKEIQKKLEEQDQTKLKEELEKLIESGKEIYKEKLKDSTKTFTFDELEEMFSKEDVKSLIAFFQTDEGKDIYKELIDKNPLYKYLIPINDIPLNNLLTSINNLNVVEVSDIDDFYEYIIKQDQSLYYIMAEKSIKDAIKSIDSDEYFGFKNIKGNDTVGHTLSKEIIEDTDNKGELNKIFKDFIKSKSKYKSEKKRYFLTFNGSGNELFDVLHNDFKTKIFKNDKEYEDDISTESKETIMKLIHKNLKIGKNISTQFAEYLVRLDAHMLLTKQKPWFVIKDNEDLFAEKCFKINSDEIVNKNAFVEITPNDYEDIKNFLSVYHNLSDKDFDIDTANNNKK